MIIIATPSAPYHLPRHFVQRLPGYRFVTHEREKTRAVVAFSTVAQVRPSVAVLHNATASL